MTAIPFRPLRSATALCAVAVLVAGCGQSGDHGSGKGADRVADAAAGGGHSPSPTDTSYLVRPDELPDGKLPSGSPSALPDGYGVPDRPRTPAATARACDGETGVRVEPGPVDSAMGLRAMPLTVTNCGTGGYRLDGYPALRALDEDRAPLDVRVFQGPRPVTELDDPGPHPVTLRRGESATSVVVWRNTYTDTTKRPVKATYLKVVPVPGDRARTVEPEGGVDLGSTGRIGTTAWQKSEA